MTLGEFRIPEPANRIEHFRFLAAPAHEPPDGSRRLTRSQTEIIACRCRELAEHLPRAEETWRCADVVDRGGDDEGLSNSSFRKLLYTDLLIRVNQGKYKTDTRVEARLAEDRYGMEMPPAPVYDSEPRVEAYKEGEVGECRFKLWGFE